jgi:hypothetical protein
MSVDISVSITEDIVDIIATPTVNIVNVTNSASIDPGLYDLSEFTNTSLNPFVRTSGLSSYVPSTRSILTTSPLVGGGDLSANRTISIPQATSSVNGFLSSTDWTTFNNKQNALGFTPVPETRTLTINGLAQDLSTDRSWTISTGLTVGTTPIASGTIGRVLFQGTGNVLQQSSSLFWDGTNERLGIGTSSPTARQHIVGIGTTNATNSLLVTNSAGSLSFRVEDNLDVRIGKDIAGVTRVYALATGASFPSYSFSGNSSAGLYQDGVNTIGIATGGTSRLQIANTGNVLINTTTDAGFRLDVNGTARVQGQLTTTTANAQFGAIGASTGEFRIDGVNGAAYAFSVYSSSTLRFGVTGFGGITAPGGLIISSTSDLNTTRLRLGTSSSTAPINIQAQSGNADTIVLKASNGVDQFIIKNATGNVLINTTTDAGFRLDVNGTARVRGTGTTGATNALSVQNSAGTTGLVVRDDGQLRIGGEILPESGAMLILSTFNTTEGIRFSAGQSFGGSAGDRFFLSTNVTFNPTSGTSTFSTFNIRPTINQTGGANGITRGLFVNPTLTAAADFRAIETARGNVVFGNLPTSPVGLPTGAIWNNLGILSIV